MNLPIFHIILFLAPHTHTPEPPSMPSEMKSIAVRIDKRRLIQFINLIRQCNKIVAFARIEHVATLIVFHAAVTLQIVDVWVSTLRALEGEWRVGSCLKKLDPVH